MIRITYLLRRKPDMSFEEFQRYWREEHGPLVAGHAQRLGIRRYVQVHTIADPEENQQEGERGKMLKPWDGVAELWFQNREVLAAGLADKAARAAGAELLEDEKRFIDHAGSAIWVAYECPQINPTPETLVASPLSPCVKFYYPLQLLEGKDFDEAQLYWRMNHGPLVRQFGPAMRAQRYVQVHRLRDELNDALAEARGMSPNRWIGHAELWFDQNDWGAQTTEAREAQRALVEDEAKFIDFSKSAMWLAKEHVFVDRLR